MNRFFSRHARTLRRRATTTVATLGVVTMATGIVALTAPAASAHTGSLAVSSVCQQDGTYKLTYSGSTTNVPDSEPGHTATFRVGEIQPAGSPISGAPSTVVGNTGYSFTQTVPGTTKYAQATAFLAWGDGAKSDPIGTVTLKGDCVAPPQVTTVSKPSVTPPTCTTAGTAVFPAFDHGHWVITNGGLTGTPVADQGYTLDNSAPVTLAPLPKLTGAPCAGDQPPAVVTHASTESANCTTQVVTVHHTTTTTGYVISGNSWVPGTPVTTNDADTTRPATAQDCTPPATPVTAAPTFPSVTPPSCTEAGSLTVPDQPANVSVTRTPATGTGPGEYTFTYAPAAGFAFPAGAPTTKTVTVLPKQTGAACAEVLGTEATTGKPATTVKTPAVEGTSVRRPAAIKGVSASAPVPSAVEAGLAGQQTDARVLLGQALLGAGLLLLAGAAWSGLGTRRRGVRQA
jgi:hypothetical protein